MEINPAAAAAGSPESTESIASCTRSGNTSSKKTALRPHNKIEPAPKTCTCAGVPGPTLFHFRRRRGPCPGADGDGKRAGRSMAFWFSHLVEHVDQLGLVHGPGDECEHEQHEECGCNSKRYGCRRGGGIGCKRIWSWLDGGTGGLQMGRLQHAAETGSPYHESGREKDGEFVVIVIDAGVVEVNVEFVQEQNGAQPEHGLRQNVQPLEVVGDAGGVVPAPRLASEPKRSLQWNRGGAVRGDALERVPGI
jgi:hypothetical protein